MTLISSQHLLALRTNMKNSPKEMASLLGVEEEEWVSWEHGSAAPNYKKIGKILLSMLFSGQLFIGEKSPAHITQKIIKAQHLNEKLAESAVGPDSTLHQYINDELESVIKNMK